MVIDDDLDLLFYVDDLLRELGYETVKATNGVDAAELLPETRPDAVVLDLGMLEHTRSDTLAELTAVIDGTPTLLMTETAVSPDVGLRAGRCFLAHPPDLPELRETLDSCLHTPAHGERSNRGVSA
jgi:CheY-like chemotaxis protein